MSSECLADSEPLAARQFPDWSMAYIRPNNGQNRRRDRLAVNLLELDGSLP